MEKRTPELEAAKAEAERLAKLAAMPDWKRKLVESKQ